MTLNRKRSVSGRRMAGLLAGAVALAVGGALVSGTAAGATAPAAATGGLTPAGHAVPGGGKVSPMTSASFSHTLTVAPFSTVTCTLDADNPFRYYGGPYGGGEEGLAGVQCSYTTTEIDAQVGLYRNGSLVANSAVRQVYSGLQNTVDTEYPVSPASYQTGAIAAVQFTDGYVYSFPEVYSASVSITS